MPSRDFDVDEADDCSILQQSIKQWPSLRESWIKHQPCLLGVHQFSYFRTQDGTDCGSWARKGPILCF
jgi:hypothetical protein